MNDKKHKVPYTISEDSFLNIQGWMTWLELPAVQLIIYAAIYNYCNDTTNSGKCYLTINAFANWTGLSQVAVRKNLKELVERGLIEIDTRHRDGLANSYKALYPKGYIKSLVDSGIVTVKNISPTTTMKVVNVDLGEEEPIQPEDKNSAIDLIDSFSKKSPPKEKSKTAPSVYTGELEYDGKKTNIQVVNKWCENLFANCSRETRLALNKWLENLHGNKKFITVNVLVDKATNLVNETNGDEAAMLEIIQKTTDRGYITFEYMIDNWKKNKGNNKLNKTY